MGLQISDSKITKSIYRTVIILGVIVFGLQTTLQAQDAAQFVPLPVDAPSQRIDLSGKWDFYPNPDESIEVRTLTGEQYPKQVQVPSQLNHIYPKFYQDSVHTTLLHKPFYVPGDWKGKTQKLRFLSVEGKAEIFVNSKYAGTHYGVFSPFELDVASFITPGQINDLTLRVTKSPITRSLCQYLGMVYPVKLIALPKHIGVETYA
jgi:beta-galactosidase/beta-glucuronidase